MVDYRRVQNLVGDFVKFYHKSMIRSWTSFINKPLFIRGEVTRSLSVSQLSADFQRDIGYFKISVNGDLSGDIYWFFEFKYLMLLSSIMLMKPENENLEIDDVDGSIIQALEALAHHGGLALVRGQENVIDLNLELTKSSVHFLKESQLSELESVIPEGLCRVVQCHLEVFGYDPSTMITVFSDDLCLQMADNEELRNWQSALNRAEDDMSFATRVLLVDTVSTYRNIIANFLKPLNLEVVEVDLGMDAMRLIEDEEFDIIFYDFKMPDMDGYHFTKWLRERSDSKDCPLILCGQELSSEVLIASKKVGMSDYLVRPSKPKRIKQIIKKFLPKIEV